MLAARDLATIVSMASESLSLVKARFNEALQSVAANPSAVNVARYLRASRALAEARQVETAAHRNGHER